MAVLKGTHQLAGWLAVVAEIREGEGEGKAERSPSNPISLQPHSKPTTFTTSLPLEKEPVLGGKKLDLLRIYKWVIEYGGFDKVTEDRAWKRTCDPFELPATCTNSAFVVKQIYQKSLLAWELIKHQGKSVAALGEHETMATVMRNNLNGSGGGGGGGALGLLPSPIIPSPMVSANPSPTGSPFATPGMRAGSASGSGRPLFPTVIAPHVQHPLQQQFHQPPPANAMMMGKST